MAGHPTTQLLCIVYLRTYEAPFCHLHSVLRLKARRPPLSALLHNRSPQSTPSSQYLPTTKTTGQALAAEWQCIPALGCRMRYSSALSSMVKAGSWNMDWKRSSASRLGCCAFARLRAASSSGCPPSPIIFAARVALTCAYNLHA